MTDDEILEECTDSRTPCEVWTRVMGYHRPVSAFNEGKKAEHEQRKLFVNSGADWQGVNPAHETV